MRYTTGGCVLFQDSIVSLVNLSLGCHFRLSMEQANCLSELLGSSPLLVCFFDLSRVEIGRPGPVCYAFTESHSLTFCGSYN